MEVVVVEAVALQEEEGDTVEEVTIGGAMIVVAIHLVVVTVGDIEVDQEDMRRIKVLDSIRRYGV